MAIKVLIIDDYAPFAETLALTLQAAGLETRAADSGQRGLEILRREPIDVVILDVMMPDMDGLEVCEEIRRSPELRDLPIIMLSARAQVPDRLLGFEVGADDYVPKPADPKEIIARVKALAARAQRGRRTQGAVIVFLGAKGGVGTTTVALNAGLAMAKGGARVILVELSGVGLSGAWLLGAEATQTIGNLASGEPRLSPSAYERHIVRHPAGLHYLPPGQHVVGLPEYPPGQLGWLLEALPETYERVLVDLGCSALALAEEVLPAATAVVPVSEHNPVSTWHLIARLAWLRQQRLEARVPGFVLVDKSLGPSKASPLSVANEVGLPLLGLIPPEPALAYHAAARQEPLYLADPECPACRALANLGERLLGSPIVAPPPSALQLLE